jgi:hypothetical protein
MSLDRRHRPDLIVREAAFAQLMSLLSRDHQRNASSGRRLCRRRIGPDKAKIVFQALPEVLKIVVQINLLIVCPLHWVASEARMTTGPSLSNAARPLYGPGAFWETECKPLRSSGARSFSTEQD